MLESIFVGKLVRIKLDADIDSRIRGMDGVVMEIYGGDQTVLVGVCGQMAYVAEDDLEEINDGYE